MNNKRIILIVGCIVVIIAAGLIYYFVQNPNSISKVEKEYIGLRVPGIEIDGQKIEFLYTDENEGESIIIKSDKEIYEGSGVSDVYFSLTNTGNKPEKIAILSYFPIEYGNISYFDVWQNGRWERMQIVRGDIKANMSKLEKAFAKRKPVPKEFEVKAGTQFEIPAGHTAYFKSEIKYPMEKRGEFWFETFGNGGGYGLLDPIFIGRATSSDTTPGWYQTGATPWDYRRQVIADKNKVSGSSDLTNFPMLVQLTANDLKHTSFGGKVASSSAGVTGGGGDFVFTSSNGTTKLDHEIEKYSSSSGELWAWVEVPTLSVSADTTLYMYYGGPSTGATNQNRTGVWDVNYQGVWHLKENPTSTCTGTKEVCDSTSNNNNGDANGTMTASDQVTGKIDGSLDFDGTDDYLDAGNIGNANAGGMTVSFWAKFNALPGSFDSVVSKAIGGGTDQFQYTIGGSAGSDLALHTSNVSAQTNNRCTYSLAGKTGLWLHITYTWIASSGTCIAYENGIQVATENTSINMTTSATHPLEIGRGFAGNGFAVNTVVDEVRVSNTERSSAWIKTEYNNQFSPKTFYGVGGLQFRTPSALIKVQGGVKFK